MNVVANAFAVFVENPVEGPVNLASGRPVTIKELVCKFVERIPYRRPPSIDFGAIAVPPNHPLLLVADVRRLAMELAAVLPLIAVFQRGTGCSETMPEVAQ